MVKESSSDLEETQLSCDIAREYRSKNIPYVMCVHLIIKLSIVLVLIFLVHTGCYFKTVT